MRHSKYRTTQKHSGLPHCQTRQNIRWSKYEIRTQRKGPESQQITDLLWGRRGGICFLIICHVLQQKLMPLCKWDKINIRKQHVCSAFVTVDTPLAPAHATIWTDKIIIIIIIMKCNSLTQVNVLQVGLGALRAILAKSLEKSGKKIRKYFWTFAMTSSKESGLHSRAPLISSEIRWCFKTRHLKSWNFYFLNLSICKKRKGFLFDFFCWYKVGWLFVQISVCIIYPVFPTNSCTIFLSWTKQNTT